MNVLNTKDKLLNIEKLKCILNIKVNLFQLIFLFQYAFHYIDQLNWHF